MATYRELKGYSVKTVTSDPSNTAFGQVWYNSVDKQIKFTGNVGGTWASGGALSTARGGFNNSFGTQTAALAVGGERTPGGTQETAVEEYDGTSWTSGGAIPTATTTMGGGGTQTAAIAHGGNTPGDDRENESFTYDGSSWTATPDMPTNSGAGRGFGTQTASLHVGGQQNPGNTYNNETMEWNGSSWSDGGDYPINNTPNQGVVNLMGFGTQTAGLCAGGSHGNGYGSNNRTNSNSYDGSSWTATNALQHNALFGGSFGTLTSGIISGLCTSSSWINFFSSMGWN